MTEKTEYPSNWGNISDPATPSLITPRQRVEMQRRARANAMTRMEDRAALRAKVQAGARIDRILANTERLEAPDCTSSEANRLKAANDAHFRLLDRVFPAAKALELQESPESELRDVARLSTAELTRLARARLEAIPGEYEVVQSSPEPVQEPVTVLSVPPNNHGPNRWPFG